MTLQTTNLYRQTDRHRDIQTTQTDRQTTQRRRTQHKHVSYRIISEYQMQASASVCSSLKSCKIHEKNPTFWGVQGRSGSLMLIPPERSSAVLVMIGSKSVTTCNRSHARRVNYNYFLGGYPSLMASFEGISSPSGTKFAHKKLETLRYHMVKTRSLIWA